MDPLPLHDGISEIDAFTEFVRDFDVACPACRKSLRHATTARCPACHEDLAFGVGLSEPRIAAFVTGLIGLSLGLGWNLGMLMIATFMSLLQGGYLPMGMTIALVAGVVTLSPITWMWIARRRRLMRGSARARWRAAALMYLLTLMSIASCLASIN